MNEPPALRAAAALRNVAVAAVSSEDVNQSSSPRPPRGVDCPAGSPPPLTPPGTPNWTALAEAGIRVVLSRHTPFVLPDGAIGCRPSWSSGDGYWTRHADWQAWRLFIAPLIAEHLKAVSLTGGVR